MKGPAGGPQPAGDGVGRPQPLEAEDQGASHRPHGLSRLWFPIRQMGTSGITLTGLEFQVQDTQSSTQSAVPFLILPLPPAWPFISPSVNRIQLRHRLG